MYCVCRIFASFVGFRPRLNYFLAWRMSDAEEEQTQQENGLNPMRERILSILGHEFTKRIDEIAFEVGRLADSKPAVLVDYGDISIEKLERFASPGLSIVEIAGKKLIINLSILDRRMPWSNDPVAAPIKPPIFVDISPGLSRPRLLNPHELPDNCPDTVGNSNLFYMTSDIVDMMREVRNLIADGERVIEKRPKWSQSWCTHTIYGCLLGYPVVLWSDSDTGVYCLKKDSKVWRIEWIDGESRGALYSFWVPEQVMNGNLKSFLQQWIDRIFDRSLPHQNYYMLQTLQTFGSVMM